jgi:hypothetical protein
MRIEVISTSAAIPVSLIDGDSPSMLATLASLPASFSLSGASVDSVVAVGGESGWSLLAADAIRAGARAIVVTDPAPDVFNNIELLAVAAETSVVPVVLAEGWVGNPAVDATVAQWGAELQAATLVEVEVQTNGQAARSDDLLVALRLLRRIGRSFPMPPTVARSGNSLALVTRTDSASWSLLVSDTAGPARVHLSASSSRSQVELDLSDPATAAPAWARRSDLTREVSLDALYETGQRRAWRRLRLELDEGNVTSDDLRAFAADSRIALALADATHHHE